MGPSQSGRYVDFTSAQHAALRGVRLVAAHAWDAGALAAGRRVGFVARPGMA